MLTVYWHTKNYLTRSSVMEPENNQSVSQQEEVNTGAEVDPIEALREIKKNSVPRSEYDRVVAERNKIFAAYANGEREEQPEKQTPVDVDALRKDILSGELPNLEYAEKVIALRNELIAQGQRDPFLPYGKDVYPTMEDEAEAQAVADALEDCIEAANGDSAIFTNELQRIMVNTAPQRRK